MAAHMDSRMYEAKFPEVDDVVMVQVKSIAEMGAYVSLLEYSGIEGMILLSELSRRRIRSITKLIKVGRQEPVMVLRVDKEKGYIDLSKRRVSPEDIAACEERFNKSKMVHSIMRHVADTTGNDVEELYKNITWPLYKLYGHAFEAFKVLIPSRASTWATLKTSQETQENLLIAEQAMVTESEAVFLKLSEQTHGGGDVPFLTEDVQAALIKNVQRRMTPQPLKIRADIELTCFAYDGVLHIQEAMRAAEKAGSDDCPVKMKLLAPPLYVLTTQTLEKGKGIDALTAACELCKSIIESHKGRLVVKEAARAVSERDDRLLNDQMVSLAEANAEVAGDSDSEAEEDEGMGDIDIDTPALAIET